MFPNFSELLVVLVIVIVLFGAGRISKLAEDLGKSVRAFRKGLNEEDNDSKKDENMQLTADKEP